MTDLDVSQMTPEQRLRQIEILLNTAAKAINSHSEEIADLKIQFTLESIKTK